MSENKNQKRIVIFAPYPLDEAPSQRFRFEQYLTFFKEQGFTIIHKSFLSVSTWRLLYQKGKAIHKVRGFMISFVRRWSAVFLTRKTDIIFIHREMAQMGPPIYEWILAKLLKRKYIYDFDDAIWLPNFSTSNAKINRIKAYWKVKYCIKWAGIVTVGNNYLADYAKKYNSNVKIIPTTIDTENYHNILSQQETKPIIIGWTGSHSTMEYLGEFVHILKKLEHTHTFKFRVISDKKPAYDLASLEYVKWNKETEILDLSAIQIGLMPLKDDIWAKGKCGFKALQYMALKIPCVVSPVGVNTEIIQDGVNGFLASTEEEWLQKIGALLTSKALRVQLGEEGRKTILNKYSVIANQQKYIDVFKSIDEQ